MSRGQSRGVVEGAKRSSGNEVVELVEPRPKSASFNNFGPLKRQQQSKTKSLLSTAASNPRFSANRAGFGALGLKRGLPNEVLSSLDNFGSQALNHD